jgi:hypothetical protein
MAGKNMQSKKLFHSVLIPALVFLTACQDPSESTSADEEVVCAEPENPYGDGGGHDAGFNWAEENGGSCMGNSDSFNEGCEEYFSQLERYEACEASKRN